MIRFHAARMSAGAANFLGYGLILSAFSSALFFYYLVEWRAFYLFLLGAAVLLTVNRAWYTPRPMTITLVLLCIQGVYSVRLGNVDLRLFVQAFVGIAGVALVSLSIYNRLDHCKESFVNLYLHVCVIASVIGLLMLPWHFFAHGSFGRLQSVFREPADFALVVTPGAILLFARSANYKKELVRALVVLIAILASQSSLGLAGLATGIVLAIRRSLVIPCIAAALVLGVTAMSSAEIRHRLDSIYLVISGQGLEHVDESTFTLIKGLAVAKAALEDSPLIGEGLGSFPNAQHKFFASLPPPPVDFRHANSPDLYPINEKDGGSLLIRSATELGICGVVFLFWLVWRFRSRSWISKAVLAFFVMKMLRHGHYFSPELFMFIGLYWLESDRRLVQSPAGERPPSDAPVPVNVCFWQVALTDHQAFTLAALADKPVCEVTVVEVEHAQPMRGDLQWTESIASGGKLRRAHPASIKDGLREIVLRKDSLHVFSGIWSHRRIFAVLVFALLLGRRVGLMTEPYLDVPVGYVTNIPRFRAWCHAHLRTIAYKLAGLVVSAWIGVVFAISRKAVAQFRRTGFNPSCIYPFGYFVPRQHPAASGRDPDKSSATRMIFIGSLIERKGLSLLASAVAAVPATSKLYVDLYGPGELPPSLPRERMKYCGVIPFGHTQAVLRNYDVLVCPSLYDGWAVVINEAVLQGVPVIVSRQTGAAAMVERHGLGLIFDAEHADDLAQKLILLSDDAGLYAALKQNIARFGDTLLPESAADYLYRCLQALREGTPAPACPWY